MPTPLARSARRARQAEAWIGVDGGVGEIAIGPAPRLAGPSLRAALRASSRCLLRAMNAGVDASGGDIQAAITLTAVMDANIGHIDLDPAVAHQFAAYDGPPPNDLRRPVSALAVAEMVRLPRETARRRIDALVGAARCVRNARGIHAPAINTPAHRAASEENFVAIKRLHRDLLQRASDGEWPQIHRDTPRFCASGPPPLRLVNRRTARFALDVLPEMAGVVGGYDEAVVYMAVVEATGRCEEVGEPPHVHGLPLAASLSLPGESVRRRLISLSERGFIHRSSLGYSAVHDPSLDQALGRLCVRNATALRRLFADLARLGVDVS